MYALLLLLYRKRVGGSDATDRLGRDYDPHGLTLWLHAFFGFFSVCCLVLGHLTLGSWPEPWSWQSCMLKCLKSRTKCCALVPSLVFHVYLLSPQGTGGARTLDQSNFLLHDCLSLETPLGPMDKLKVILYGNDNKQNHLLREYGG